MDSERTGMTDPAFFISEAQIEDIIEQLASEDIPESKEARSSFEKDRVAVYKMIFSNVTPLHIPDDNVIRLWKEIMSHKYVLSEKIGRNVGFRVAALDYLFNIKKSISSPTFLENTEYEQLINDAQLDFKTGVYNTRTIYRIIDREIDRSKRYGLVFSLLLLDLDNFKVFNDTMGHLNGDKLLSEFAAVLKNQLRGIDVAARFGGDEFCILFPQTHRDTAMPACRRINANLLDIVENSFQNAPPVSLSGGIVMFPFNGISRHHLLSEADNALYRAKEAGKNKIFDHYRKYTEPKFVHEFGLRFALEGHPDEYTSASIRMDEHGITFTIPIENDKINHCGKAVNITMQIGNEEHRAKSQVIKHEHIDGKNCIIVAIDKESDLQAKIIQKIDFEKTFF